MKETCFWTLTVDQDVRRIIDIAEATYFVDEILRHHRGWASKNYQFRYIQPTKKLDMLDMHIRMSSPSTIRETCPNIMVPNTESMSPAGLSCTITGGKVKRVLLNAINWNSPPLASGMGTRAYRFYVVNHEVGHVLGRGHAPWPKDPASKCPIMTQQTINGQRCKPNPFVI